MANERRLIDTTDENIKAILEKVPYYPDEIWKFTAMTKRFPEVEAVPVVRCKDCISYGLNGMCALLDIVMACNDFCSYGERREGE